VSLQSLKGPWPPYTLEVSNYDTVQDSSGREIARPEGLPYTGQQTQKDEDKHPCLKRDSNPRFRRKGMKAYAWNWDHWPLEVAILVPVSKYPLLLSVRKIIVFASSSFVYHFVLTL
jgi:hypothetical protein